MHAEALSSTEVSSAEALITEADSDAVASASVSCAGPGTGWTADLLEAGGNENPFSRPKCLLPEAIRRGDGVGPVVSLDDYCAKLLVVTLDITNVVERTGLTVSVWGSPDQIEWASQPLVTFRQRQYCGVYSMLLNLATHSDIRYVRVQWTMHRWGRTERVPQFGFEVFVEQSGARISVPVFA